METQTFYLTTNYEPEEWNFFRSNPGEL